MKIRMFVPDYEERECFDPEHTHQATLMDVIINSENPTPAEADPPEPAWTDPTETTITALSVTSDFQPQRNTIADWLQGFTFGDDPPYPYMPASEIDGPYTDDDGMYVNYTGSDWLYFIGTPQDQPFVYSFAYSGSNFLHGWPYPKLRLDEFAVGAVPCVDSSPGVPDTRNFTLSYETRTDKIYFRSETIDGETVHTLIIPDQYK
jgi:hypothetical protein